MNQGQYLIRRLQERIAMRDKQFVLPDNGDEYAFVGDLDVANALINR